MRASLIRLHHCHKHTWLANFISQLFFVAFSTISLAPIVHLQDIGHILDHLFDVLPVSLTVALPRPTDIARRGRPEGGMEGVVVDRAVAVPGVEGPPLAGHVLPAEVLAELPSGDGTVELKGHSADLGVGLGAV